EERTIRREARVEQQAVLNNLVHIAAESFLTEDDLLMVKYTRWLLQWHPAMTSASVVEPDGAILAHSEPDRIGRKADGQVPAPSETKVLSAPVRLGSRWVANASVAFSQTRLEQAVDGRLQQLKARVGAVALGSLLLGLMAS